MDRGQTIPRFGQCGFFPLHNEKKVCFRLTRILWLTRKRRELNKCRLSCFGGYVFAWCFSVVTTSGGKTIGPRHQQASALRSTCYIWRPLSPRPATVPYCIVPLWKIVKCNKNLKFDRQWFGPWQLMEWTQKWIRMLTVGGAFQRAVALISRLTYTTWFHWTISACNVTGTTQSHK